MTMRRTLVQTAATLSLALGCAAPGQAAVIYDNGPFSGAINATSIRSVQAIGNSFTLAAAATLRSVTFASWSHPGDALLAVDWGISDTLGVLPSYSTALIRNGPIVGYGNVSDYEVRYSSFEVGEIYLSAGTHFLWLAHGAADDALWDVNDGPSLSYFSVSDIFIGPVYAGSPGTNSNSFQLSDAPLSPAPEPLEWTLLLLGFFGIGAVSRRRTSAVAAAAKIGRGATH